MKIAVGFITYEKDTYKYLSIFLPSLIKSLDKIGDYKIFCVDNSVKDLDNLNYIRDNYQQIEVLSSGQNLGFSKAYNLMFAKSSEYGAKHFLIINPDTYLEEDACNLLVKEIEMDSSLGSVSPLILSWDFLNSRKTNIIDSLGISLKPGLRFIDLAQGDSLDSFSKIAKLNILGISGAAGLYRMSALEKAKEKGQYFDENIFMYKEDADLAYRLFLKGYTSKTVENSRIYHDRTVSKKLKRKEKSKFARKMSFLGQHIIYIKYFRLQNTYNKMLICKRILLMFVYVLFKERFQLYNYLRLIKNYKNIIKY